MFTSFRVLTLAAAAMAVALPRPQESASTSTTNQTFSLAMQVGYGDASRNLTLVAVPNGSSQNSLVMVGCGESPAEVGTPVYTTGVSPKAVVNAKYADGEIYGLRAADVGDNYGIRTDVTVTRGDEDPEWSVVSGELYHQLYAGSNLLMACNQTLDEEEKYVLSFGVLNSNGSFPYGCQYTRVFTVCNQPSSSASC